MVKMKQCFEELMRSTADQTGILLIKAEQVHKILWLIYGELGTLYDLADRGRNKSLDR